MPRLQIHKLITLGYPFAFRSPLLSRSSTKLKCLANLETLFAVIMDISLKIDFLFATVFDNCLFQRLLIVAINPTKNV